MLDRVRRFFGGRSAAGVEAKGPLPREGPIVPANASLDQVIAAHRAFGAGPYGFGSGLGRAEVFSYGALMRCVTAMSGMLADLLTNPGTLQVLDEDGKLDRSRRALNTRDWLALAPGGPGVSAHTWWEDIITDLCLGNALAYRPAPGVLARLRVSDADIHPTESGVPVYFVTRANDFNQETMTLPPRRVFHARWGQMSGTDYKSQFFSTAPIIAVRVNSAQGKALDEEVVRRFGSPDGWKNDVVVSTAGAGQDIGAASATQAARFTKLVGLWSKNPAPLAYTDSMTAMVLKPKPAELQMAEQQEMAVLAAARIYGIPSIYLGLRVSEWGSGISQIRQMFWQAGLRPFAMRLLAPFNALLPRGRMFSLDPIEFMRGDLEATAPCWGF